MLRTALRTALAATLLLAACSDDEDEPGASVFIGDMTGAYTASLSGEAVFGVTLDDAADAAGSALIMGGGSPLRIVLFGYTTPKPRVGTYEIVAPGSPASSDTVFQGSISYRVAGASQAYQIRSGSITFTRVNHNRVTGSLNLHAEQTSPADSAQISILGLFDAGQIPQVFPQPPQQVP